VLRGHGHHTIHVRHLPIQMYGHNRSRFFRHFRFDLSHIQIVSARINVNEYRRGTQSCNCARRRKKCVWRGDNLVAWANVFGHQASQQSITAGSDSNRVSAIAITGNRFFAFLNLGSQDEMLGLHDFRYRGVHFSLDRCMLRLKIEQGHLHTWPPLSIVCKFLFPW
jgi:hypothetical protein